MTSHDVVAVLRRKTGIRQIGHTGTLDPLAQGVLPVSIGKATRLIEYLKEDKEYLATIQFGASTTTFDIEGEIQNQLEPQDINITEESLKDALKSFEGEIEQIPPIYSAIKVKGRKLYEYAKKGETVEIKPRKVFIEKIELKEFDERNFRAKILVKCSKGTYIRSIANDLGKLSGAGGYLTELIRTQSGKFRIENSIDLDSENIEKFLINPIKVLDLPKIEVCQSEIKKIKNGMPIKNNTNLCGTVILVYNNDEICAAAEAQKDIIKVKKVFL